jgi:hypothetical protein
MGDLEDPLSVSSDCSATVSKIGMFAMAFICNTQYTPYTSMMF